MAAFIAEISGGSPADNFADSGGPADSSALGTIPWHLSAYHPDYQWDVPPTDATKLRELAREAREQLRFVYTGNIPPPPAGSPEAVSGGNNNTVCPACGETLVSRRGYKTDPRGLVLKTKGGKQQYHCARCGETAPFVY
jgi:pyruvate formate lyase activating enzyme